MCTGVCLVQIRKWIEFKKTKKKKLEQGTLILNQQKVHH
jgi:hypothetical protein